MDETRVAGEDGTFPVDPEATAAIPVTKGEHLAAGRPLTQTEEPYGRSGGNGVSQDGAVEEHTVGTGVPALAGVHAPGRAVGPGLLIALLGAWGAVIAYAGPSFGYGPRGAASWSWTTPHTVLNLIPGVVALVAGLVIMRDRHSLARAAGRMAALLAFGAGAWFVLGRAVYPIFYKQGAPDLAAGHGALAGFVTVVGYGLGIGVALCVLAGMAMAVTPVRWSRAGSRAQRRAVRRGVIGHGRVTTA